MRMILIVVCPSVHGTPWVAIGSRVVSEERWQVWCIKRAIRRFAIGRLALFYTSHNKSIIPIGLKLG